MRDSDKGNGWRAIINGVALGYGFWKSGIALWDYREREVGVQRRSCKPGDPGGGNSQPPTARAVRQLSVGRLLRLPGLIWLCHG